MGEGLKRALVLGSADCLQSDLDKVEELGIEYDGVVAVNAAGTMWPGELNAWVSLHPRYFLQKDWRKDRADKGYPASPLHVGHLESRKGRLAVQVGMTSDLSFVDFRFEENSKSGSSGLFGVKYALVHLCFEQVLLCGVPMTPTPHFTGHTHWRDRDRTAESFRNQWKDVPVRFRKRMKSMSGWTKALLGGPDA